MIKEEMFRGHPRRIAAVAVTAVIVLLLFMSSWGKRDMTVVDSSKKDNLDVVEKEIHAALKPTTQSSKIEADLRLLLNTKQSFCRIDSTSSGKHSLPWIKTFTWLNQSDITSRLNSSFEIIKKKDSYEVCDRIHVKITARNGRNEQKKVGGDYFRARIVTNDHRGHTMSSKSDDEVYDHGDGTYKATFTLKWPGEVVIRIYLVHPSEAVSVLQKQSESGQARYSYKGIFCSDDGMTQEERECNVFMSPQYKHVCKFTDRRTRLSWYCHHPTMPGLNCSHWCRYRSDSRAANAFLMTSLTEKEKAVFKQLTMNWLHSREYTIQVKPDGHSRMKALPPCKPGIHSNSFPQSGYYADDEWVSSYCNILRFSSSFQATTDCLRGITLFFLGDSTVKQLFNYFMKILEGNIEIIRGDTFSDQKNAPILAVDKKHRTNLIFRTHGYPIGDDAVYDIRNIQYLANIIDDMQVGEKSVVTISIWRYFTPHNASLYEERLRTIVEAVKRLHKRSPKTLVIFNSPNTGNMDSLESAAYSSDWYARHLDDILRRALSGYEGVGFLDSWDMTNAQLFPHRTHPVGTHIQNLADHLMSYICPSS